MQFRAARSLKEWKHAIRKTDNTSSKYLPRSVRTVSPVFFVCYIITRLFQFGPQQTQVIILVLWRSLLSHAAKLCSFVTEAPSYKLSWLIPVNIFPGRKVGHPICNLSSHLKKFLKGWSRQRSFL